MNGCKQADPLLMALKGKPLGGWSRVHGSPSYLHCDWVTTMIRCNGNQVFRIVIHINTIPTLDGLTSEFSWDLG